MKSKLGNAREGHYPGPGATLWALRWQVKRDVENGTDRKHLVPYGIVLAYAEQAVDEEREYRNRLFAKQAKHLLAAGILFGMIAFALGLGFAAVIL